MTDLKVYYKGQHFRSHVHARWAVFFDSIGVEYEYQPELVLRTRRVAPILDKAECKNFSPDFWLPHQSYWVVLAHHRATPEAIEKAKRVCQSGFEENTTFGYVPKFEVVLLSGDVYNFFFTYVFAKRKREIDVAADFYAILSESIFNLTHYFEENEVFIRDLRQRMVSVTDKLYPGFLEARELYPGGVKWLLSDWDIKHHTFYDSFLFEFNLLPDLFVARFREEFIKEFYSRGIFGFSQALHPDAIIHSKIHPKAFKDAFAKARKFQFEHDVQQSRKGILMRHRRREFASNRPDIELALIERDGYVCSHPDCDEQDELAIDHIYPLSKGGTDNLDNLRFLCHRHNSQKRDKVTEVK